MLTVNIRRHGPLLHGLPAQDPRAALQGQAGPMKCFRLTPSRSARASGRARPTCHCLSLHPSVLMTVFWNDHRNDTRSASSDEEEPPKHKPHQPTSDSESDHSGEIVVGILICADSRRAERKRAKRDKKEKNEHKHKKEKKEKKSKSDKVISDDDFDKLLGDCIAWSIVQAFQAGGLVQGGAGGDHARSRCIYRGFCAGFLIISNSGRDSGPHDRQACRHGRSACIHSFVRQQT